MANSTVTVTATKAATATEDGVALTRTLSDLAAGDIANGKVAVEFTVAGNCTEVTTPADGSAEVTETGHSCSLSVDGEWSVTATYTQTGDYSESAAAAAISVWVDNVGPTVTITSSVSPVPVEGTSTVTFTAVGSGAVSGFSFGSVSHSGSGGGLVSLSTVPSDPAAFTATFTAGNTVGSTYMISVPEGVFVDRAGNQNSSSQLTLTVARPTIAVDLVNSTASAQSANPNYSVTVTRTLAGCATASHNGTRSYTLVAGETKTAALPNESCDTLTFTHAAPVAHCTLTATPAADADTRSINLAVSPPQTAPVTPGTTTTVASVSYEVVCVASTFDATVSLTLADPESVAHTGRSITVSLTQAPGGPAAGCSPDRQITVPLGASSPAGLSPHSPGGRPGGCAAGFHPGWLLIHGFVPG